MKLWIDATAGVAGDMLLGALVDAGAGLEQIQKAIDVVIPDTVALSAETVDRAGQRATKVHVKLIKEDQHHRHFSTIADLLAQAPIHDDTCERALGTFARLAAAEANVHGVEIDEVHFHEVGAWDSIADVVGVCEALRLLDIHEVTASPIQLGSGRIQAAHGNIPVPAPAVAELVIGWPVLPSSLIDAGELATPTGVALIRYLATETQPSFAGTATAVGIGAGTKDFAEWPNVVRIFIGEQSQEHQSLTMLEANVDDLDPRLWQSVLNKLLDAGAKDAWLTPILMKKQRPAHTISVLTDDPETARSILFTHTTTFGVRSYEVQREELDRRWEDTEVEGQTIRVKVGSRQGVDLTFQPEYEDVARAAEALSVSEKEILRKI